MVSLSNITLQISLPLQKIQCEVLRVLKSFLISWPIHTLRLWSLSCATSTFASLSMSLLKNHVDGKFVQDKENFANHAQMWVVTLNGPGSKYMQKKTITWKFDWLLSTRIALFFSNIFNGIHRSQNMENSDNMETHPRIFLFWLFCLVK